MEPTTKTPAPAQESKPSSARKSARKREPSPSAPLDALGAFAASTSNVVARAASILEEELAAGIVAAKSIEQKFVDTEGLRASNSDEIVPRLRKDAHDVVDILLDFLQVASNMAGSMASRALSIRGFSSPPGDSGIGMRDGPAAGSIQVLRFPGKPAPGQTVKLSLLIENNQGERMEGVEFQVSDAISPDGGRIEHQFVAIEPAKFDLEARSSRRIEVALRVPGKTKPGSYTLLVQSSRHPDARVALLATVEPS